MASSMRPATSNSDKLFTIEDANACLPLVRAIVSDMVQLAGDLDERRIRLEKLTAGRDMDAPDLYGDELAQIEEELAKDAAHLEEYIDEVAELGVETSSVTEGLIGFPSKMEGQSILLCWRFDEPDVAYWREPGEGSAERRPLPLTASLDGDCGGTA